MEANTSTPSRKARKIILPRAYSASGGLIPRSPAHQNRSGAVSGRSEPWRRTPQPLAQSAKDHPPQSLLSDRRPDAAEPRPPKTRAERCRAGASLGGEHPQPPRAKRERSSLEPTQRAEARCRGAPPTKNRSGAVSGRSEPWRRTPQSPRAKRESSSFPEPTQRPEARCRGAPTMTSE